MKEFSVASGNDVLSVSALLREARLALENRLPLSWVSGEISNFSRASSGHCYFTLKDEQAQVECVLYRSRAAATGFELRNGMRVEVRALPTLYEPRGRFQLQVEAVRRAGLGPLYERFLRLKESLAREGVFDEGLKRTLPRHPSAVGVVTSATGAALRDVLTALRRRNPAVQVLVYPTPVQGDGAAELIAHALATASRRDECDLLLLVRGGGSIEDLWQFNEACVARAIRASRIPVIVGVGHETDFTIADFAADLRAPTPTAAAELAVPDEAALRASVSGLAWSLARELARRLDYATQSVDHLSRRLIHPAERLRQSARVLAHLYARLSASASRPLDILSYRLSRASLRLVSGTDRLLRSHGGRVAQVRTGLAGLDPRAVLGRGYSITLRASGAVLTSAEAPAEGEHLTTVLVDGQVESVVSPRRHHI